MPPEISGASESFVASCAASDIRRSSRIAFSFVTFVSIFIKHNFPLSSSPISILLEIRTLFDNGIVNYLHIVRIRIVCTVFLQHCELVANTACLVRLCQGTGSYALDQCLKNRKLPVRDTGHAHDHRRSPSPREIGQYGLMIAERVRCASKLHDNVLGNDWSSRIAFSNARKRTRGPMTTM